MSHRTWTCIESGKEMALSFTTQVIVQIDREKHSLRRLNGHLHAITDACMSITTTSSCKRWFPLALLATDTYSTTSRYEQQSPSHNPYS